MSLSHPRPVLRGRAGDPAYALKAVIFHSLLVLMFFSAGTSGHDDDPYPSSSPALALSLLQTHAHVSRFPAGPDLGVALSRPASGSVAVHPQSAAKIQEAPGYLTVEAASSFPRGSWERGQSWSGHGGAVEAAGVVLTELGARHTRDGASYPISGDDGDLTTDAAAGQADLLGTCVFLFIVVLLLLRLMFFKKHPNPERSLGLPSIEVSKDEEADPEAYAEKFVPPGNIFRYLARDCENRKHQEDLHRQLKIIAKRFGTMLDALPPDTEQSFKNEEDRRCRQLISLLRKKSESAGQDNIYGVVYRVLGEKAPVRAGMLLLPTDGNEWQQWCKNRFMATIISAVMLLGPSMIIANSWYSDSNAVRNGVHVTKSSLCRTGSVEFLGTLFLILVFEYVRQYALGELRAFDQMSHLPGDSMWLRMGQTTNYCCILSTVLAMPLIFWGELMAKDIVYDSMAMIFIFGLDDLSSDVLQYLNCDDNSFRARFVVMVRQLQQTPVELTDITNPDARQASEIWQARLGDHGLALKAGSEIISDTRLYATEDAQSGSLKSSGGIQTYHTITKGRTFKFNQGSLQGFFRVSWVLLYYALSFGEVFVPIVFMVAS